MTYRRPGTYARFVRTVSPAINSGGSRILGLVGTGINYFTIQNEAVLKSSSQPYDELANKNVFEILSVSSKPIYDGLITDETKIYNMHTDTQTGYRINDNIINWDYLVDPTVSVNYATCPDFYYNNGSANVIVGVDLSAQYPVIDGSWVIEVSYINEEDQDAKYNNTAKLGCYRIINANTSEIIGEYVVSDDPVLNEDGTYPIPGVMLTVKDTFIPIDTFSTVPAVNVGDYITITTVAAKTETEAKAYKQEINLKSNRYNLEFEDIDVDKKTKEITLKWFDITGDANRYYLYAKTSVFEGSLTDPQTYTDSVGIDKTYIQGALQYTFDEDDMKRASGYTESFGKKFKFTITDTTEYTDDEKARATKDGVFKDAEDNTVTARTIKIAIEDYDSAKYRYAYKLNGTGEELDPILLTRKITSNIDISKATGIELRVYTSKDKEGDKVVYYNCYNLIDEGSEPYVLSNIVSTYNGKTGKVVYDSKSVIVSASEEDFNSTQFVVDEEGNVQTEFYFMLVAIDENDNPVDFVYSDDTIYTNMIYSDGEQLNSYNSFGVVTAQDQDYALRVTATGEKVTVNVNPSTDDPTSQHQASLFNAIDNVQVIANETLYQHNAVYRITLVQNAIEESKLRITRYVNGELDMTWLNYAGIDVTESNKDNYYNKDEATGVETLKDEDEWLCKEVNSRYLADIEGEMFDVIPGVTFTFDVNELPNLAYGTSTIIVSTPRVVNEDVPAEGDTYYVSYKYRKAEADYDPIFFTDYDDIVATYGNYDVSASSAVLNSLSLAAEIAFNNGVSQIVCCQAKNNSDYEMQSAIDRMRKEVAGAKNVSTIIPLTTSDAVGAYLANHVDLMSSYDYGKERMGYLGARIGQAINKIATKADRSLGMTTVAEGYDNERIVYVVPGAIKRQIRDLRTGKYNTRTLPGVYAAVAVASVGLSNDPAEPLTNKTIAGFTELVDLYSESEKNILANSGCCVLEHNGQSIRIRHGITTNNNEVNSQEITLIQIKDYVIDGCRNVTGDTYIGRKLTATLIADIKYTMENLLNGYVAEGVIISYSSLKVKRNADEPRQVDISFEIEAVYPLNWISIEFGFSAVQ